MQFLLKAFLLFFLIIAVSTNVIGQIQLKLNAESGAYIDLNSSYSRNVEFMNKFLGSAEFIEQSGKNIYKLGLKLRPQFFNAELHSIKYRLDGTYAFKSEDLEWRAGLSYTNYDYRYTSAEYSYGIFQFINIIDLPLNSGLPVSLLFGYSRYSLEYANTINSDIFHIRAGNTDLK